MPSLLDLDYEELQAVLRQSGLAAAHAAPLWNALHFHAKPSLLQLAHLPPPLLRWLDTSLHSGAWESGLLTVNSEFPSEDNLACKYLLQCADAAVVETVLMRYSGRMTACVSTQVGCAMGCVFCATGQRGLSRHLTSGEIVAQVHHLRRLLMQQGQQRLRNLVLMGMGEPLHNYDAVMKALRILTDTRGANIGPSRITISTVGLVSGIRRLAQEKQPYHLAVSLHACNDAERSALVPVNDRWPLQELIHACKFYQEQTQRKIFFAWTLIAGVNDTLDHAAQIVSLLKGLQAHVNLIPLNPTLGFSGTEGSLHAARQFQSHILAAGIPCTLRQKRGIDVTAGCGQLAGSPKSKK